ncbi:1-phosphatidylinositol 4 5-bisphosphate phosphodiesterase epsilon-1-like isoform X1, partial [Biomphalaria pfeifferi]
MSGDQMNQDAFCCFDHRPISLQGRNVVRIRLDKYFQPPSLLKRSKSTRDAARVKLLASATQSSIRNFHIRASELNPSLNSSAVLTTHWGTRNKDLTLCQQCQHRRRTTNGDWVYGKETNSMKSCVVADCRLRNTLHDVESRSLKNLSQSLGRHNPSTDYTNNFFSVVYGGELSEHSKMHNARKISNNVGIENKVLNSPNTTNKDPDTNVSETECCVIRPGIIVKHLRSIKRFSLPNFSTTESHIASQDRCQSAPFQMSALPNYQSNKDTSKRPDRPTYCQSLSSDDIDQRLRFSGGQFKFMKTNAQKLFDHGVPIDKAKCQSDASNVSKSLPAFKCSNSALGSEFCMDRDTKLKTFTLTFGMNVYTRSDVTLKMNGLLSPEFVDQINETLLQQLIVNGDLRCSKEEAATLAGIQLHIEEAWPETDEEEEEDLGAETPNHQNNNCGSPTNGLAGGDDGTAEQTRCFRLNTETEKLENLKHKKELIRSRRAHRITSTRRSTKLARSLLCTSDNEGRPREELDLSRYLPPHYTTSKKVRELIEDKQKKLWHTPYYENEVKLKQLYIKICKNLPSYGCKLFQVKEILRGNTQKKVARLLAISNEKIMLLDTKTHLPAKMQQLKDMDDWLSGTGKAHDSLVLEFRGTKAWTLAMPSVECLKSVTAAIWEALDMDGRFLNNGALQRESFEFDYQRKQLTPRPELEPVSQYTEELERLRKMLHFPEEVAMMLTTTEHKLFCSVPPQHYVRHVTMELSRPLLQKTQMSVEQLIQRFNEVSSWITQLIVTQATHDDRKAVLSCILRLAVYCWVLGNFNSAVEILCGLRSEKLKPFWLSIEDEDLSTLHSLSDMILTRDLSPEYKESINRALDIPECKVVPFFGSFLRELKSIFVGVPSIIVLPSEENHSLEFVSDYNGEDRFMTRIGVGGLINLDKLRQAHLVLGDIHLFQYHGNKASGITSSNQDDAISSSSQEAKPTAYDSDSDYDLDLDSYQPVKPLTCEHDVMVLTPRLLQVDLQTLQILNHGTTMIQWDEDAGRSSMCVLRLEADNATVTWCRPGWSALRGVTSPPDFIFHSDRFHSSLHVLCARYGGGSDDNFNSLEEGFLDVMNIKEVYLGDESVDLAGICKRHGLETSESEPKCITIVHGNCMSANHKQCFIGPKGVTGAWYQGLCRLKAAAGKLRQQMDKRILWLKQQYLQLYYEGEKCQGPTPAEAIK